MDLDFLGDWTPLSLGGHSLASKADRCSDSNSCSNDTPPGPAETGAYQPLERSVWNAVQVVQQRDAPGVDAGKVLDSLAEEFEQASGCGGGEPYLHFAVTALCNSVKNNAVLFRVSELCRTARALARLSGCSPSFKRVLTRPEQGVLHAIRQRVLEPEVLLDLSGRQAVQFLHAFAKMQVHDEALVEGIGQRMIRPDIIRHLDWQGLSMTLWALARLQASPPELMSALAAQVIAGDVRGRPSASHLANIMWALATLGVNDADLTAVIAVRTVQEAALLDFKSHEIANTAWAFATLGTCYPDFMAALASRTMQVAVAAAIGGPSLGGNNAMAGAGKATPPPPGAEATGFDLTRGACGTATTTATATAATRAAAIATVVIRGIA